jgi:hypothetical protein
MWHLSDAPQIRPAEWGYAGRMEPAMESERRNLADPVNIEYQEGLHEASFVRVSSGRATRCPAAEQPVIG